MTNTPAGWYPDPYDPRRLRWWDGSQWTDSTHPLEQGAEQTVQAPETSPTAQYGGLPSAASSGASPGGRAGGSGGLSGQFAPPSGQGPAGGQEPPSGQGFGGPGQPPSYGDPALWGGGQTAQLPMPDFGSQPQRNSAMPWVLGGVALLAALALILGGTLFLLNRANNDQPVARDVTQAPLSPGATNGPQESPTPGPSVSASPQTPPTPVDGRISDPVTGLSYPFPGKPWEVRTQPFTQSGDPTELVITSGYSAVSMAAYDGKKGDDWVGSVYAAQLPEVFPYQSSNDLEVATGSLLTGYEQSFYGPQHTREILRNEALTVSGHQGWIVEFQMDFTAQSNANHWKWKKERGAFVLVDRGQGERPSMLYISVPDNLDQSVITQVLDSLEAS
ncbi:DUF2510 domain-containing protein [Streptosporangiaceae bacterium NEAU-GS5]|nr:DUF2510 domain-containing protein [Streptosporangiaceae bacterium NEAU-GS5]